MNDRYRPAVIGRYYSRRDGKQSFLRRIFDDTAPHYERINSWGWFGTGDQYRRVALLRSGVTPEMRVIDVASGTGAVARALLKIVKSPEQVVCVEPSTGMIAESRKLLPEVRHLQSTTEALPVEDDSFDALTMGFALRHVDDLKETFAEFRRVLKPGGRAVILDVTTPSGRVPRFLFDLYFRHVLPGLSYAFTWKKDCYHLMKYYWQTMDEMTPPDEICQILREAGFEEVEHRRIAGCFSEFLAFRR